jgi:hypothetical protein
LVQLALGSDPEAPLPTEFRLFAAGLNETRNGPVLFDDAAARAVLADFERGGVDLMIDLAHDSLSEGAREHRDDADDARGWFRLAVRDGELWAVDVTWTSDGTRRLRDRTQRYISPAVDVDEDDRIVRVVNAALCARPATLNAPALVAREITLQQEASRMDPALVKKALDALEGGDAAGALELLKSLIASAATGEAPKPPADDAPAEPLADDAEPPPDPEKDQMSAQLRQLREERAADRRELDALRAERQEREDKERRALVGELVTLECELPATAWEDPTDDAPKPTKRLRDEPIADLRARVALQRESKPERPERRPPAKSSETVELSEAEQKAYDSLPENKRARFLELRTTAVKRGNANG